jgi:hypothetical protein
MNRHANHTAAARALQGRDAIVCARMALGLSGFTSAGVRSPGEGDRASP